MDIFEILDTAAPYTGLFGTVLSIINFCWNCSRSISRIQIREYSKELNGFYINEYPKEYDADRILVLHFEISNPQNSVPCSIRKAFFSFKKEEYLPHKCQLIEKFSFNSRNSFSPVNDITPFCIPLKLENSDVVLVQMIFPFVKDVFETYKLYSHTKKPFWNKNKSLSLKIKFILNSGKSKKIKVVLKELTIENVGTNKESGIIGKIDPKFLGK